MAPEPEYQPDDMIEERPTIAPASPRLDWRRDFLAADGLLFLLGVWLLISPFVLSYGDHDYEWLPALCGALIAVLAAAALVGVLARFAAAWIAMAVAVLLFTGAFWAADSAVASWNAAAGGAVAFFLAIVVAAASSERS